MKSKKIVPDLQVGDMCLKKSGVQGVTRQSRSRVFYNTDSNEWICLVCWIAFTSSRPHLVRSVARPANGSFVVSVGRFPGASIGRRTFVARLESVLNPFPHVAGHAIETKVVRWLHSSNGSVST